jgi:hypothetical protein
MFLDMHTESRQCHRGNPMRKIPKQRFSFPLLVAVVGLTLICNCTGEKNVTGFSSNSQSYYPLGVGYTWYYESGVPGRKPNIIYTSVEKKIVEGGTTYFILIHGSDSIPNYYVRRDTVFQDDLGRIWKKVRSQDYLWFDFTYGEGDTYGFQNYTVIVNRNFNLHTPAGSFINCIELFLFDPAVVDSQQWLYFAPGVGLVKSMVGEGPTAVLHSYHD